MDTYLDEQSNTNFSTTGSVSGNINAGRESSPRERSLVMSPPFGEKKKSRKLLNVHNCTALLGVSEFGYNRVMKMMTIYFEYQVSIPKSLILGMK